jgi:hypothetical protein
MRAGVVVMDRLGMDRLLRARLVEITQTPQRRQTLLEIGLRDTDVRRLVRQGVLQHHHGHYIDGGVDDYLARVACAHAQHPGSVVSHFSAANLAGLRTWSDDRRPSASATGAVWLTRPPTAKRNQRRADVVVRRAVLTRTDLSRHQWLPVTSTARTVVDLARELPFREATVTIDHALRIGLRPTELEEVVVRQSQWPGIGRARIALAFGDPLAESALESIARVIFAAAGLPAPVLQVQFWDSFMWMPERVDFWWPQYRTVGEADGLAKYEAATVEERRRLLRHSHRRDQRLSDRGIELVHFGWEDVVDPSSDLIPRLQAAFTRGRARPGDPPLWRPYPHPLHRTAA